MNDQHFHGTVYQVAGGNIENQYDADARAVRRQELLETQQQHLDAREEAQRSIWRNRYTLWCAVGGAAVYALMFSGWLQLLPWWSSFVLFGVGIGWPYIMFQRHRNACAQTWRHHNQAIGAINDALAVL